MNRKNIETILPLLPMQQSFLWHSLREQQHGGVVQLTCRLTGDIELNALQAVWLEVVSHYQALRSTVHWQGVPSPVQMVHRQVEPSFCLVDTSVFPTLESYLQHDRLQDLDLARPVPHRLVIFPVSDDTCHVVWTMSHVLLDGWSCTVVVNEWVRRYTLMRKGRHAPEPALLPLTDHSRWIKNQNDAELEHFWNTLLPLKYNSDPLPFQLSTDTDRQVKTVARAHRQLSVEEFSSLGESIRAAGISLNTVLQACFATLLHARGSIEPVVFSTSVSGRHIDIAEVDKRVGMLMNVMPVCVHFDRDESIGEWLRRQQQMFFACLPHAHASVQQLARLRPHNRERFRCLLVIENQPTVLSTEVLDVTDYRSDIISEFDLTLSVIPAQNLFVELRYDTSLFRAEDMDRLLVSLSRMLCCFTQLVGKPVAALDTYKWETLTALALETVTTDMPGLKTGPTANQPALSEPHSVLLHTLHEIWCEVLERSVVAIDESFFDIGGTSMQAVMMFELIEKRLQCRLPATSLFNAGSIASLAEHIETVKPELAESTAVVINSKGTQPPLFIPFEQVDMLIYQQLLSELGGDQPVYGLPVPLHTQSSPEVLQTLIGQIEQICPSGALRLAGLSGAGHIAWALAQKLTRLNREVDLLILLDTYGPDFPHLQSPVARLVSVGGKFMIYEAKNAARAIGQLCRRLFSGPQKQQTQKTLACVDQSGQLPPANHEFARLLREELTRGAEFVSELSPRCALIERTVNRIVLAMYARHMEGVGLQMELIASLQGLLLQHHENRLGMSTAAASDAAGHSVNETGHCADADRSLPATQFMIQRYRRIYEGLEAYDGRVLLCRASRRPAGLAFDPHLGWKDYLGANACVTEIPGDHRTLLKRPNVRYLADAIRAQCKDSGR